MTDKYTGQPIFKELVWFVYKVSGVMRSDSACDHYWSIKEWIHSKRRNRLSQELVERLHKPGAEGEFGCSPSSSITVGHRACHR